MAGLGFDEKPAIPLIVIVGDGDELFSVEAVREFFESINCDGKDLFVTPRRKTSGLSQRLMGSARVVAQQEIREGRSLSQIEVRSLDSLRFRKFCSVPASNYPFFLFDLPRSETNFSDIIRRSAIEGSLPTFALAIRGVNDSPHLIGFPRER